MRAFCAAYNRSGSHPLNTESKKKHGAAAQFTLLQIYQITHWKTAESLEKEA
ncbi:hypothetical protein K443DRAFT_364875 [Laccaria amethystina LaAM-08-1]|uniref:Uncharacterized protein n=1 Tax=Laccaria amethystina LaAM-08-1 TaxID=1095629 RepID=A0A0C9X994_9AGAR|nr:hypothetical protein K443DRAFT_364875 [Laccaria amethystina LaAM-08-1]